MMTYQLGAEGTFGFHDMLACLERRDFDCAADEAISSKWDSEDACEGRGSGQFI